MVQGLVLRHRPLYCQGVQGARASTISKIMTIIPTTEERKYVCIGWNLRQNRYYELSYLTTSADAARARCQELNPDFAIDRVEERV